VTGSVTQLQASGQASGNAWVELNSTEGLGLSKGASAYSGVSGSSGYVWRDDGTSKTLSVTISMSITGSDINYDGYAWNGYGTSPASCHSRGYVQGGGNLSYVGSSYPYGSGEGNAGSASGTWDDNDYSGALSAGIDQSDSTQGADFGSYEGRLAVTGSNSASYSSTPWATSISASTVVSGSAGASGQITLNDPLWHYGLFDAFANYSVSGSSTTTLSGNIADRE
jgi:hypothetical protein